MDELMRKLLALTDEQFEVVVAGARAARDIVGGPRRIGRPRGSKNAAKPEKSAPLLSGQATEFRPFNAAENQA